MTSSRKPKHKHKILLDEGLPPKSFLLKLNRIFDVKHIRDDLKKAGASDSIVYGIARDQQRVVITYNVKDFKPLIKKGYPSVIGVSAHLSPTQIDIKLTALLRKLSQGMAQGQYIAISKESIASEVLKNLERKLN